MEEGWQRVFDISERYCIVFPETFSTGEVIATEEMVVFRYQSDVFADVLFEIRYYLTDTFDMLTDELGIESEMWEIFDYDGISFGYIRRSEQNCYRGIVLEYGSGETEKQREWNTLQVEFIYPAEKKEQYETEEFQYYITRIP